MYTLQASNGINILEKTAQIQDTACKLGVACEVETSGLKFYPSVLVTEGEFTFRARPTGKYRSHTVQEAIEWLEDFDIETIKESYDFERAYAQFLAQGLPTI